MPVKIIKTLLSALLLLMVSCASIPMSTLARFSSFGKADLAALVPADIRVRVQMDNGARILPDSSTLKMKITISGRDETYQFPLSLESEDVNVSADVARQASGKMRRQVFKLSPAGVKRFHEFQTRISASLKKGDSYAFSVYTNFDRLPAGVKSVRLWIDIKFRANQDFIPIMKGAHLKFALLTHLQGVGLYC